MKKNGENARTVRKVKGASFAKNKRIIFLEIRIRKEIRMRISLGRKFFTIISGIVLAVVIFIGVPATSMAYQPTKLALHKRNGIRSDFQFGLF